MIYFHIYIYIYIVSILGPVKPKLGVIHLDKKLFMNEYLNFPGKELNVTIILSNKFFKKNNETGHIGL